MAPLGSDLEAQAALDTRAYSTTIGSKHIATSSPSVCPSLRNITRLRTWAPDFSGGEDEAEKQSISETSIDFPSLPAPATLISPKQHHRSLTSLRPFRSRPVVPDSHVSPTKDKPEQAEKDDLMPTFTGDNEIPPKAADHIKGISSWFSGSSAPMPVGIPVAEQELSSSAIVASLVKGEIPTKLRKQQTMANLETPKSATTSSFFTLFGSPKSPKTQGTVQLPAKLLEDDYLLSLDIPSTLYPQGKASEKDSFSPAAFKNLMQNAEGLLGKLQAAYKLRTVTLHELTTEADAQREELDEAQTRATHLKMQLEDMAKKAAVTDKTIDDLNKELANERESRKLENEARKRTVALIKARRLASEHRNSSSTSLHSDQEEEVEEDLGVSKAGSHHRRDLTWRHSNASNGVTESDDEVDTQDSVFSRSRSPTLIDSSAPSILTPENGSADIPSSNVSVDGQQIPQARAGASSHSISNAQQRLSAPQKPKLLPRASTFAKMLRGGSSPNTPDETPEQGSIEQCKHCNGGKTGVAWDTVSVLQVENKGLKSKMEVFESSVDDTLSLIAGWGY